MKNRAATRDLLDHMSCQVPDCTHEHDEPLFLHSRCHVEAATWCSYQNGVLTVKCSKCEKTVIKVEVAP